VWVELALLLLICAAVVFAKSILRRRDSGPATYWVMGWLAAGAGGILGVVRDDYPIAQLIAYPLGSCFPALLLAGAFLLAARPVPGWLCPAAIGFGLLRSALAAAGLPSIAYLVALAVEPPVVLAAAWVVHRATPRTGVALSQRLLAPSLVVLAVVGAIHDAWIASAPQVPPGLLVMWVVAVPPLFGAQIHSEWERGRRLLQRAREELEERVLERTAALRKSEERYRVVSELGSDLAFGFLLDRDERISEGWVTDAYSRITGYKMDELSGSGWLRLIHPDDEEKLRLRFAEILAGQTRELELRLISKSGRVATVHARLDVTREAAGAFRVVGAARDVTDARRAEAERRDLERQVLEARRLESLSMLTGGVAHDFNNLLAVILGNSRMAASELPPGSPLNLRLARIRAAAEHGAALTEQMLAYSGRSGVALKPLDLSHLVEEMVDLLRASISEQARLELELAPRAPVEGDTTQIRQVVLNLVTNASEALTGGAGRLRVSTGVVQQSDSDLAGAPGAESPRAGAYAYLEVSDDGQGMDAATQARVFEPFFTTKFSGRGLGLAAVLGIVRTHSGVVRVWSGVGSGTRVRVLLPERRADFANPPQPRAGGGPSPRRGTILVVDDQDFVLEVAQAFLERAGHRVVTASGGRSAIEIFRQRSREIDAVLLDLAMPDTSGEEVLLEIQRVRSDARVIIATGYSAQAAAERLASHGVVGFVRKPYQPEEILQQVDRALAASGARSEPQASGVSYR
jgi:PAS domain S-box-containing protein